MNIEINSRTHQMKVMPVKRTVRRCTKRTVQRFHGETYSSVKEGRSKTIRPKKGNEMDYQKASRDSQLGRQDRGKRRAESHGFEKGEVLIVHQALGGLHTLLENSSCHH